MALDRLARELRKLIDEKKVVICEKEQQVLAVIKQTTKTLEGWDVARQISPQCQGSSGRLDFTQI